MSSAPHFLHQHEYAVLFGFVLAEQLGLPIPALPVLLAVGALAGSGEFTAGPAVAAAVGAALVSDLIWYELGRRGGRSVLSWMCRISLEPDSCVRRTEVVFERNGPRTLLLAKFVPGLSTAAPPIAGMFRMRLPRFLLWDALGAVLWAGSFIGAGYLFSAQLEMVARWAMRMGSGLVALLAGGLAAYIAWKWTERERLIRRLRVARITPEELKNRLDAGEDVIIVDLRHSIEADANGKRLPGAIHMQPDELDQRHLEIPRDREIVLYCT